MAAPPELPPSAPSLALMDGSYAALAREIAQDIRDPVDILPDYGFTGPSDPNWQRLQKSHDFIGLLMQAAREWNAADSTSKRIRYKALASLELVVAEMHVIALTHSSAERRIEAAKFIKSIAGFDGGGGIGGRGAPEDGTGGVSITINIGPKTVSAQLTPQKTIEGQAENVT
jgi:hypothetical protein